MPVPNKERELNISAIKEVWLPGVEEIIIQASISEKHALMCFPAADFSNYPRNEKGEILVGYLEGFSISLNENEKFGGKLFRTADGYSWGCSEFAKKAAEIKFPVTVGELESVIEYVETVYVTNAFRGRGIAKVLLDLAVEVAEQDNHSVMCLGTFIFPQVPEKNKFVTGKAIDFVDNPLSWEMEPEKAALEAFFSKNGFKPVTDDIRFKQLYYPL